MATFGSGLIVIFKAPTITHRLRFWRNFEVSDKQALKILNSLHCADTCILKVTLKTYHTRINRINSLRQICTIIRAISLPTTLELQVLLVNQFTKMT